MNINEQEEKAFVSKIFQYIKIVPDDNSSEWPIEISATLPCLDPEYPKDSDQWVKSFGVPEQFVWEYRKN